MAFPVAALEEKLGYRFHDRKLLIRALTHRSWPPERSAAPSSPDSDNEQLEFLGDSILGFVASEALVSKHADAREGQLSKWKSHLVSAAHLHDCARALEVGDYLLLGKGEDRNGGRERKTVLANALEAIIAAIYCDGGLEAARNFLNRHVLTALDDAAAFEALALLNHKSVLQERTQALGLPAPRYFITGSSGPEHAKVFTVEARVNDRLSIRATGSSKKTASQRAAELLSKMLEAQAE
ncbi:MAG: ribonuclease III [Bryobacteraceae bacterium]